MHEQVQITDIVIPFYKLKDLKSLAESMRSVKVWNISSDMGCTKRPSTLHDSIFLSTFCIDSKAILKYFLSLKSDIPDDGIWSYKAPFYRISILDLTMQDISESLDILRKLPFNIENLLIKGCTPEDLEVLLDISNFNGNVK